MKQDDLSIPDMMQSVGRAARAAYAVLANASAESKRTALWQAAASLRAREKEILEANSRDMEAARARGLTGAMLDRLELTPTRIAAMADGVDAVAEFPDPVGRVLGESTRPNGLTIRRVSVPLGVIGIIYESRPNVTADAGALCLKSGNAAILRGGSESFHSSAAILTCLQAGLAAAGLPEAAIQAVPVTDRAAVGEMLTMTDSIDVIIPRGGKSLTERIQRESRIPTLQHLDGNCHTYIHASADPAMAEAVVVNAKLRRTGICGATESLVIDRAALESVLPRLADALIGKGCELRGDEVACAADNRLRAAAPEDWDTEYLDAVLSVKTVEGPEEAIAFINRHSSHHTDAIIAGDSVVAERFLREIDSAIVMHNTSTQFADGGEFGMGAEIGISTGRLHARGPVGCDQLTTYKYVVSGNGQVRG